MFLGPLLIHPLDEATLAFSHEPLLTPITKPFKKLRQALFQALTFSL